MISPSAISRSFPLSEANFLPAALSDFSQHLTSELNSFTATFFFSKFLLWLARRSFKSSKSSSLFELLLLIFVPLPLPLLPLALTNSLPSLLLADVFFLLSAAAFWLCAKRRAASSRSSASSSRFFPFLAFVVFVVVVVDVVVVVVVVDFFVALVADCWGGSVSGLD